MPSYRSYYRDRDAVRRDLSPDTLRVSVSPWLRGFERVLRIEEILRGRR
jgi:hypothetical protein